MAGDVDDVTAFLDEVVELSDFLGAQFEDVVLGDVLDEFRFGGDNTLRADKRDSLVLGVFRLSQFVHKGRDG